MPFNVADVLVTFDAGFVVTWGGVMMGAATEMVTDRFTGEWPGLLSVTRAVTV